MSIAYTRSPPMVGAEVGDLAVRVDPDLATSANAGARQAADDGHRAAARRARSTVHRRARRHAGRARRSPCRRRGGRRRSGRRRRAARRRARSSTSVVSSGDRLAGPVAALDAERDHVALAHRRLRRADSVSFAILAGTTRTSSEADAPRTDAVSVALPRRDAGDRRRQRSTATILGRLDCQRDRVARTVVRLREGQRVERERLPVDDRGAVGASSMRTPAPARPGTRSRWCRRRAGFPAPPR